MKRLFSIKNVFKKVFKSKFVPELSVKEELEVFEILPDEICIEIFKFLPMEDICQSIALVNNRFARLYRLAVHTINITGNLRKLPEDNLIKVLLRFEKLEKLIICNNGSLEDYQITNSGLIQFAHKYIYANADYSSSVPFRLNYSYGDFGYEKMLDNLSTMESCSVFSGDFATNSESAYSDTTIDDILFKVVSECETASTKSGNTITSFISSNSAKSRSSSSRIRNKRRSINSDSISIILEEQSNMSEEGEDEIKRKHALIRAFNDPECEIGGGPEDRKFYGLVTDDEEEEVKEEPKYGLSTLRYLDLAGCYLLTDFGVKYLTFLCKDINHLYLRGCSKLTDCSVEYFKEFKYLKSLNLGGLTKVTDNAMKTLSENLTQLEKLDITFCRKVTNEGLRSLSNIDTLTELKFQCCILITADGLLPIFNKCKKLKYLNLTGCSRVELCKIPEDGDIVLEDLEYLSLLGCTQTCDKCMDTIVERMKCARLKKFKIAYCDKITDEGVKKVLRFANKALEKMNLKRCTKLSHLTLKNISRFCRETIKSINLTGINFNSIGFVYLKKLTNLEQLSLQSCQRVNPQTLNSITKIKHLEKLDLSFNENITYKNIKSMCNQFHPGALLLRVFSPRNYFRNSFSGLDSSSPKRASKIDTKVRRGEDDESDEDDEGAEKKRPGKLNTLKLMRCVLSHKQKRDLEKYFPMIKFTF